MQKAGQKSNCFNSRKYRYRRDCYSNSRTCNNKRGSCTTRTKRRNQNRNASRENQVIEQPDLGPRRSVVFIGSECYPFVKTGGLGDVMSALPKSLAKLNVDVKVILPRYKCIPWEYQEKMEYKGSFYMDLCSDGRQYYVGIMEYQEDGVIYDFIDNEEFFSWGNPYTNLIDDIPKFCIFPRQHWRH